MWLYEPDTDTQFQWVVSIHLRWGDPTLNLKRTKMMEFRMFIAVLSFLVGLWLYAVACWHVPWMSW